MVESMSIHHGVYEKADVTVASSLIVVEVLIDVEGTVSQVVIVGSITDFIPEIALQVSCKMTSHIVFVIVILDNLLYAGLLCIFLGGRTWHTNSKNQLSIKKEVHHGDLLEAVW